MASPLGFEPRTTPLKAWFKTHEPLARLIFVIMLTFKSIRYDKCKEFQVNSRTDPARVRTEDNSVMSCEPQLFIENILQVSISKRKVYTINPDQIKGDI